MYHSVSIHNSKLFKSDKTELDHDETAKFLFSLESTVYIVMLSFVQYLIHAIISKPYLDKDGKSLLASHFEKLLF